MRKRPLFAIVVLIASIVSPPIHATIFCASSSAAIASAFTTAETNNVGDEVRIVAGTYMPSSPLEFAGTQASGITISGGWNAGCTTPRIGTTTIDAQHLFRALRVSQNAADPAATVQVSDLTLIAGKVTGAGESGGGLYVFNRAAVLLERLQLIANHTQALGGGVYVFNSGSIIFRDNLAFGNITEGSGNGGGAYLSTIDATLDVTNNTLVGNSAPANKAGGLGVFGGTPTTVWLSNNIIWNNTANGANDATVLGNNVRFYNDVGTILAQAADPASQGNVSIDPVFHPCSGLLCFDFHLARNSPLIDAGFNSAAGGIGSYDADDQPRLIAGRVDIGAFELDTIFEDGFD